MTPGKRNGVGRWWRDGQTWSDEGVVEIARSYRSPRGPSVGRSGQLSSSLTSVSHLWYAEWQIQNRTLDYIMPDDSWRRRGTSGFMRFQCDCGQFQGDKEDARGLLPVLWIKATSRKVPTTLLTSGAAVDETQLRPSASNTGGFQKHSLCLSQQIYE